jgi:hypothetical protein
MEDGCDSTFGGVDWGPCPCCISIDFGSLDLKVGSSVSQGHCVVDEAIGSHLVETVRGNACFRVLTRIFEAAEFVPSASLMQPPEEGFYVEKEEEG